VARAFDLSARDNRVAEGIDDSLSADGQQKGASLKLRR